MRRTQNHVKIIETKKFRKHKYGGSIENPKKNNQNENFPKKSMFSTLKVKKSYPEFTGGLKNNKTQSYAQFLFSS
jgi:hypothetical protein